MRAFVMARDAALHREARHQRQVRELRERGGVEEGMGFGVGGAQVMTSGRTVNPRFAAKTRWRVSKLKK